MNYIFFQTADNNSALYPTTAIRGIRQTGNLQVTLFLDPLKLNEIGTGTPTVDSVVINFLNPGNTTIKGKLKAFAKFVNKPSHPTENGFLILGSDVSTGASGAPGAFVPFDEFNNLGTYTLSTGA